MYEVLTLSTRIVLSCWRLMLHATVHHVYVRLHLRRCC